MQQFAAARTRLHNTAVQKAISAGNAPAVTAINEQIALVIQQEEHIKLIRAMVPPTPDEMKKPVLRSAVEMYDRLSFQLRYYYIACTRSWEAARLWKGQDFESRDARMKSVMRELAKNKEGSSNAGRRRNARGSASLDGKNQRKNPNMTSLPLRGGYPSTSKAGYPSAARGIAKVPGFCWKCGGKGHMAPECPKRYR